MSIVLRVDSVSKTYESGGHKTVAVRDVSFQLEAGQTLCLIGESGAGKSTVGRIVLGLTRPTAGTVTVIERYEVFELPKRERRQLSRHIGVVFQEPYQSLNPRMKVGAIVAEPLLIHDLARNREERRRRVSALLDDVGLSPRYATRFPRELSGGEQQRVGIARALAAKPQIVVLDEPTSSLDLSIQSQILRLLSDLQNELGLAYLYISHDLQTVSFVGDAVMVMSEGRVVESGSVDKVLRHSESEYTKRLLNATLPTPSRTTLYHLNPKPRQSL